MKVTVTARNFIPFEKSIPVSRPTENLITIAEIRNFSGTLRAGGTANLDICLKNDGKDRAFDVTAKLSTSSPYILTVLDQDKNPVEVVLGYEDAAGYENGTAAIGAIVGRNANRIGGACVTINGIDYKLAENDGKNNLHSGPDVYQKRMWRVVENGDDHVTFLLHSPDGDQGYPGALDMKVTYTLDEENGLTIHYEAVPDQDTVINMTNHSYFNLNGHKSGSVLHHRMQLLSDAFTPADAQSIPTGEVCSVDGTPMDFRSTKELGAEIDAAYEPLILGNGYDHNWVLKNEGRFDKVAEVTGDESGIVMEVWTDRPGVQVYTANFLENEAGRNGAVYQKRDAVCLETQNYPDAVHQKNFPEAICKKGETYDTKTAYRFHIE